MGDMSMRVERTFAISSALPLPRFQSVGARTGSPSADEASSYPASRVLEEIAMHFDLHDMDTVEALQLANRLMEEDLLTSAAYLYLTGVPMRLVTGVGCQPLRGLRSRGHRYDYVDEFECYVSFDLAQDNGFGADQLQFVLNLLGSLDALRRDGPVNLFG